MPKETFFNLPEEKRMLIRDIALDEFAEYPYDQASINRIVAKAGSGPGFELVPLMAEGAVVQDPGRVGRRAGLRRGDILHAVNGEAADTTETTARLLEEPMRRLSLDVQRGNRRTLLRFRV